MEIQNLQRQRLLNQEFIKDIIATHELDIISPKISVTSSNYTDNLIKFYNQKSRFSSIETERFESDDMVNKIDNYIDSIKTKFKLTPEKKQQILPLSQNQNSIPEFDPMIEELEYSINTIKSKIGQRSKQSSHQQSIQQNSGQNTSLQTPSQQFQNTQPRNNSYQSATLSNQQSAYNSAFQSALPTPTQGNQFNQIPKYEKSIRQQSQNIPPQPPIKVIEEMEIQQPKEEIQLKNVKNSIEKLRKTYMNSKPIESQLKKEEIPYDDHSGSDSDEVTPVKGPRQAPPQNQDFSFRTPPKNEVHQQEAHSNLSYSESQFSIKDLTTARKPQEQLLMEDEHYQQLLLEEKLLKEELAELKKLL